MDITAYRNKSGESLIEIEGLSSAIAWLNESIAQDKTKEEMLVWCENYYKTLTLTTEENESVINKAKQNSKLVPKDFLIQVRLSCEILYRLISEDIGQKVNV